MKTEVRQTLFKRLNTVFTAFLALVVFYTLIGVIAGAAMPKEDESRWQTLINYYLLSMEIFSVLFLISVLWNVITHEKPFPTEWCGRKYAVFLFCITFLFFAACGVQIFTTVRWRAADGLTVAGIAVLFLNFALYLTEGIVYIRHRRG